MLRILSLALTTALIVTTTHAAEVSAPRHAVIAADKQQLVAFDRDGKLLWSLPHFGPVHRIQILPNGHVLTQRNWTLLVELDADRKVVWEYDAQNSNGNAGKTLEVHAFQRLENGRTMIVENGVGRIIEVDDAGKLVHEMKYRVSQPNAHSDVRQAYKLPSGNYLVCHEKEGRLTEYAPHGDIVWEYEVPLFDKPLAGGHGPEAWGNQLFNARRLENGNTLIATGNGHSVIEVTPTKEIVWQLHQHDLPGITLAWTTTLEVLPSGNILLGNCHAGKDNPQLIELTREKQVVWTFHDWDALGDSVAAQRSCRCNEEMDMQQLDFLKQFAAERGLCFCPDTPASGVSDVSIYSPDMRTGTPSRGGGPTRGRWTCGSGSTQGSATPSSAGDRRSSAASPGRVRGGRPG